MSAEGVFEAIARAGVVPVVTVEQAGDAERMTDALVAGGLPVVEITLRTDAGLEAIARLAARSDALVGAGTVIDRAQVDSAVDAGARFVVSPGLEQGVVERARERGVAAIPGIATATELMSAAGLGLGVVKLFPAEPLGGAATVRALSAVLPDLRFLPTGGIGPDTAPDYLALEAVLAVGGSWMVPQPAIADGDWNAVEVAAQSCRRLVSEARCPTD